MLDVKGLHVIGGNKMLFSGKMIFILYNQNKEAEKLSNRNRKTDNRKNTFLVFITYFHLAILFTIIYRNNCIIVYVETQNQMQK